MNDSTGEKHTLTGSSGTIVRDGEVRYHYEIDKETNELKSLEANFFPVSNLIPKIRSLIPGVEKYQRVEAEGDEPLLNYINPLPEDKDEIEVEVLNVLSNLIENKYSRNCSFQKVVNGYHYDLTIAKSDEVSLSDVYG